MPAEVRQLLAPRPKPEYLTSPSQIRWRRLGGPFGPISMVPAGVPVHRQPLAPRDGFQPVVRANATCGHLYLPQRCQWWRDNGRDRSSSPEWPLPDTHTASWSAYPCRSGHRCSRNRIERAWSMEQWLEESYARRGAPHLRSGSRGRSSARGRHSSPGVYLRQRQLRLFNVNDLD